MPTVIPVAVRTGRSYDVRIGTGLLQGLGEALGDDRLGLGPRPARCALVADEAVAATWADAVRQSLAASGLDVVAVNVPSGEASKTMARFSALLDAFAAAGLDRTSPVVAVGGGVVGDLAGFAAAAWLRGVPLVAVPTTLLAMVDSSVGGKTGIDHPRGKNLIGAFHSPHLVVADLSTLQTLPAEELRAGAAEVVKYGVIRDAELFAALQRDGLPGVTDAAMESLVARCVAIKADVVGQDEREAGLRRILNFGHTVGHAIEAVTDYRRFRHGEAVAIGMVAAARLAEALGTAVEPITAPLRELLARIGLPVAIPDDLPADALLDAMSRDKKVRHGRIHFVLPVRIGEVTTTDAVTEEHVRAAIAATRAGRG